MNVKDLLKPKMLMKLAAILFAVLAMVMLAAPGAFDQLKAADQTITACISLAGLAFGNPTIVTKITLLNATQSAKVSANGGLSVFALLAFILLLVALIGVVMRLFVTPKKDKFIDLGLSIALLVAGIFAFLTLTVGGSVTDASGIEVSFADFYNGASLGAGAILFGIFSIIAGASLFFSICIDEIIAKVKNK